MSKLNVDTIEPRGVTTLTLGGSGDTVALGTGAGVNFRSSRNMIINGAMQIAQRGTSIAGGTSDIYSLDRFALGSGSSFDFDVTATQNTTSNPDGFGYSLKLAVDSTQTPTSSHNGDVYQGIEGYNVQSLMHGTAAAKTFTLSFYVKAVSKTGSYSVCCVKKDASGAGFHQVKEFSVTTSWVRQEIIFEADTTNAIRNSSAKDLVFYFNLAAGVDDITAPTTAWASGGGLKASTNQVNFMDSTSNEFYITGVQMEVGSVATPFEHRTYGQELEDCKRYFQKSYAYGTALGTATQLGNSMIYITNCATSTYTIYYENHFDKAMRAAPTVTVYDSSVGTSGSVDMSGTPTTASVDQQTERTCRVSNGATSPSSDIRSINFQWKADAEL